MRTTLDLDRALLERAKEALGAGSFTEAIEAALREVVSRAEAAEGWAALERTGASWPSVEELLEYRRKHGGRAL